MIGCRRTPEGLLLALAALLWWAAGGPQRPALAGDPDFVPRPGEFPPAGAGVYLAGELVSVDHVNRRGALRLVGDHTSDRYHAAPSHRFALLPYGQVRYHGAPAELRDVPLGTVLHGYFTLPPEGDNAVPAPDKNARRYWDPHTHALWLGDDFSFYTKAHRAWKIEEVDVAQGRLRVSGVGPALADGLQGEQTFELDAATRVWRGRQLGSLADLAVGQTTQVNLSWAPDWQNGQFYAADVWVDDEARATATEAQRQVHLRFQRHRWLAGWVDQVEHQPGGQGIVTVTLFGGMDPALYDLAKAQAKPGGGAALAAAEPTLRSWWQDHDNKSGPIVELKELADPPPGSSGLQFRVQIRELLEGFRPGRVVRFRPNGFPNVKLPPEERIKSLQDRL